MKQPPPWSYSSLTSFETCPKRYFVTRVSKEVVEPQTEVLRWGNEVHKALELRMKDGTPLPAHLVHIEPITAKLSSQYGQRLVEHKMAVDASFHPVGWFDKSAWCRGVVDLGIIGATDAALFDWKTGKRKPESQQLKLMSALTFAHFPFVQVARSGFVWLQDKAVDRESFTREQAGEIWNEFLPRVNRLEQAYSTNKWPEKPSGLCGKWCPVTKTHCQFGK